MALIHYIRLTRPPNLLTAVSDIWAGAALSGGLAILSVGGLFPFIMLSFASVCLYAGGVVMNDVCDRELDAKERPERPIPSGAVSARAASAWGWLLLILGILSAAVTGITGAALSFAVAATALLYDRWGKHHALLGPLNMGLCRGLNLWLGMSLLPHALGTWGWVAIAPVLYIAAITLIARGEVHGGNRRSLATACFFYSVVIVLIGWVAFRQGRALTACPFLLLFAGAVFPSLLTALHEPSGAHIRKAVKAGVLALILLNASWVAAAAGIEWAVVTALLLPASWLIARSFAVT